VSDPARQPESERNSEIQAAVNERARLHDEGHKRYKEGRELRAKGEKLYIEDNLVVNSAVIDAFGVDAKILWAPEVTINGVTYTPEPARVEDSPTIAALKHARNEAERARQKCVGAAMKLERRAKAHIQVSDAKGADRLLHDATTHFEQAGQHGGAFRCIGLLSGVER